jgi:large subunit ribosomal protein L4
MPAEAPERLAPGDAKEGAPPGDASRDPVEDPDNDIRVLDGIKLDQPKTKLVVEMYKKLGIDRTCLFALTDRNESVERSARNIDRTTLTTVKQLNVWDILRNRTLLMTKDGLEQLTA